MNSPSFDIVFFEIPWHPTWVWGGLVFAAVVSAIVGCIAWRLGHRAVGRMLLGLAPLPLIVGGVWEVIVARVGIDSVAGTLALMACAVLAGGMAGWWAQVPGKPPASPIADRPDFSGDDAPEARPGSASPQEG